MTSLTQSPSSAMADDDLERFDRYYLIGPNGSLHFNAAGKARLAPWFARHGFALQFCTTEPLLKDTLRQILAIEMTQAQAQLQAMLDSGECSPEERQVLESLLRGSPNLKDLNK